MARPGPKRILTERRVLMDRVVERLEARETIDGTELDSMLAESGVAAGEPAA